MLFTFAIVATLVTLGLLVVYGRAEFRAASRRQQAAVAADPHAREAIAHVGNALAATHDTRGLLPVILDATVEATGAAGGRVLADDRELARVGETVGEVPIELDLGESTDGGEIRLVVDPPEGGFSPESSALAEWLASQASIALENARLHQVVRAQAVTDELTGLVNRRRFVEALESEISRASRLDVPLSLLFADLDDFKRVNDCCGHPAGDEALRTFAQLLRAELRGIDTAARMGGEEFAVILPGTRLDGAMAVAERIRAALADRGDPARGAGRQRPHDEHRRRPVRVGYARRPDRPRGRRALSREGTGEEPCRDGGSLLARRDQLRPWRRGPEHKMRTPGTLIRFFSLLAAAGAATYFWSVALTGRTARELLRGPGAATPIVAPKVVHVPPAAPKPSSTPKPPRTTARPQPSSRPTLEPVPQAIAESVARVNALGSLPTVEHSPFGGLVVARPPSRTPVTPHVIVPSTVEPGTPSIIPARPVTPAATGIGEVGHVELTPAVPSTEPETTPVPEPTPAVDAPDTPANATPSRPSRPTTAGSSARPATQARPTVPRASAPSVPAAPATPTPSPSNETPAPQSGTPALTAPATGSNGGSTTTTPTPPTTTPTPPVTGGATPGSQVTPTPPTPPTIVPPTPPTPPTIVAPTPPTIVAPIDAPTPPTIDAPTPPSA